ncbi:acyl-CoA synthetase [Prauserella cavernicola]|uniref:Long-chain fatty acid--CoA ligase n=1 Tax=Prauserella cavernicola TaxID=2800127 RepID=A0A934QVR8_9PSEU|nr:long-chain fatty acid--CoA ligase [Prauserella cavernicola]MBK1787293.1 long-chain fatty acid--CoA ligase [Prauserella cavernicola]
MRLTQALSRAVQHRPTEPATIFHGRTRTWEEFGTRSRRAAGALQRLGITDGERVAILGGNSDDYAELFFATAWAGGVTVPLNTRWSVVELARSIADCRPSVLVVDDAWVDEIELLCADVADRPVVVTMGERELAGTETYDHLATTGVECPESDRSGDDLAFICYTGGTTSSARGVMLSHSNLISCALMWIGTLDFSDETRFLHTPGFFHMAGAAPLFALTLAAGTHIILPKFEPAATMETIEKEQATYCLFVPTMITMLLNHPDFPHRDLTSVKTVEYGASPMPEALVRRVMRELPSWNLIQGYGCTEATALVTALPTRYHVLDQPESSKLRSAGRAAAGIEVRIVDLDGEEVPRGTVGEIAVRGPAVMLGYWDKPEETAAVLRNGWLHTGDAAFMDDEGFVTIVDRLKDMIVTGGENVYSGEVEQAIYHDLRVAECAVIGIPDGQWGERVHAIVVPRPGATLTAEDVIAHCNALIGSYKCPKSVEISAEPLPLSGAGKIMKQTLRAPFWEGQTRAVH